MNAVLARSSLLTAQMEARAISVAHQSANHLRLLPKIAAITARHLAATRSTHGDTEEYPYRFGTVQNVLQKAVQGRVSRAHESFWDFPLDQLIKHVVKMRGKSYPLVTPGDGLNSNVVKAMLGHAPFGSDLPNPPSGALFRRMPPRQPGSNYTPQTDSIYYIVKWIDDGCPSNIFVNVGVDKSAHQKLSVEKHMEFWRNFDVAALFNQASILNGAVMYCYMQIGAAWEQIIMNDPSYSRKDFQEFIHSPTARDALTACSKLQIDSFAQTFGTPLRQEDVFDTLEFFGKASMPLDDKRLNRESFRHHHIMDGVTDWTKWHGNVEASLTLGMEHEAWKCIGRAVLLGFMHDGIYRERFPVRGFNKNDPDASRKMREFVRSLDSAERIIGEIERVTRESQILIRPAARIMS